MPLGTTTGASQSAGGKIATGGRRGRNAVGESTFEQAFGSAFSSGSFSGADIKVYLNYPVNEATAKTQIIELDEQIQEANEQLSALRSVSWTDPSSPYYGASSTVIAKMNVLDDIVQALSEKKSFFEKWQQKANLMSTTMPIAEIQTLAWSIYREKNPVRPLGSVYPRDYVRGPRTIAGTMVFTLFDKSAMHDLLVLGLNPYSTGTRADRDYYQDSTALIDQLPPLDFSIVGDNEYGKRMYMNLWGIDFMNDGGTYSIEDLYTETVIQYVARDIDLPRPGANRELDVLTNLLTNGPRTASELYRESVSAEERAAKRRNPYI